MNYTGISEKNLKQFVNFWNSKFPLDFWWRQKHNIPFNSSSHCQSTFIDQYIEYLEDKYYNNISIENNKKDIYQPGKGNFLKKKIYTNQEIDQMFNSINLDEV